MVSGLKPYPALKESGVERLGEVPAHWGIRRLRTLSRLPIANGIGESAQAYRAEWPRYVRITDIAGPRSLRASTTASLPPEVAWPALLEPGDILFAAVGATYGKSYLYDGACGPACFAGYLVRLTLNNGVIPEFLSYWSESSGFWDQVHCGVIKATIENFSASRYKRLVCPIPSINEQRAIVRFLDHADRRIRRYIRAKERLIELLEEQKQTIIHLAVTGQIDVRTGQPYPAYKDSGVEWLGEVPENWERRPSKRTFTPRKELARPDDIQLSATQAYGVIAQKDYEERVGRKIVKIFKHLEKRRHVEVDDFIISMRSFQGGLERAWVSGCIRSSYIVLRAAKRLNVTYFGYLFKSVGYIRALQSTANFIRDGQDLNFGDFCRVDIPFPPIETQRRVAEFLDSTTDDIATTLDRYRCQIDLLREYRTRLIADVVTGKLDVREAADSLPDVDPLGADDTRGGPEKDTTMVRETPDPALPPAHP